MKNITVNLVGKFALLLACVAQGVTVMPRATDEALINPGMGFVFYHMAGRMWAYGAPVKAGDPCCRIGAFTENVTIK